MNAANDNTRRDHRAAEEARLAAVRASHWTGSKYSRDLSAKDIAAAIRRDIKAAVASGSLPKGVTVGVRCARAGWHKSITIKIASVPAWLVIRSAGRARQELSGWRGDLLPFYTAEARALIAAVEAIANVYNYDRSDSMTDYFDQGFFLHVGFDSEVERADRERVEAEVRRIFA